MRRWIANRLLWSFLLAALGCSRPAAPEPTHPFADASGAKLTDLSAGETELRNAFNGDVGHVRMVLILSPT